jgi:2-oxoisovalerate dehydrogenase E2 component (dihydrolipoyl transacylase)
MPDTRDFPVPDLGEGLDDLTIVAWQVAVGDTIELNQTLCTVETAKAEVDVPSPHAGTVVALGGEEGETLAVGSLLARIAVADAAPGPAETAPETAAAARTTSAPPTLVGYGPSEATERSRRSARPEPVPTPRLATVGSARPRARPPVRRLARQLDIDLRDLAPGSGPDGIVTRADVEAARPATPRTGREIPVRGVRARMAERLADAHRDVPTAAARVVVDCTRLLSVRDSLNRHAQGKDQDPVITPFALLAHFATRALRTVPTLNAAWDPSGPTIRVHDAVHLGIATATDRGLVVTAIADADRRGVHDLASELARLSGAARAGTATPAELSGSTFTISNFGALGLDDGTPVLNPPEAAILGVGAIRRRAHVVGDEVVPRSTAALTLVFDHRIADGADAGRYMAELRALIETPELALL